MTYIKHLKADYILANPPFNDSDWGQPRLVDDPRWKFGTPPAGNANYAWLQHMIDKLGQNGKAAIVLANGSLSSTTSNEAEIRKSIILGDLVEAIIALPDKEEVVQNLLIKPLIRAVDNLIGILKTCVEYNSIRVFYWGNFL